MDTADYNNKWLTWNNLVEWSETRTHCKAVGFTSFDSSRITFFVRNPEIVKDNTNRYIKFVTSQTEFFLYKNGVLSISRIKEGWELILENMEKVIIYTGGPY